MYKYDYKMFRVMAGEELAGCTKTRQDKESPTMSGPRSPSGNWLTPVLRTISPQTDATKVLALINQMPKVVHRLVGLARKQHA
jgi:hypothetical protein